MIYLAVSTEYRRTDGRTDRRTTIFRQHSLRYASSCSKNVWHGTVAPTGILIMPNMLHFGDVFRLAITLFS